MGANHLGIMRDIFNLIARDRDKDIQRETEPTETGTEMETERKAERERTEYSSKNSKFKSFLCAV